MQVDMSHIPFQTPFKSKLNLTYYFLKIITDIS